MIMNLTSNVVQICRVDDKNASYYVEVNKKLGHKIVVADNYYTIVLSTELFWRSPEAKFVSVPDGTYVFNQNNVYLLEE